MILGYPQNKFVDKCIIKSKFRFKPFQIDDVTFVSHLNAKMTPNRPPFWPHFWPLFEGSLRRSFHKTIGLDTLRLYDPHIWGSKKGQKWPFWGVKLGDSFCVKNRVSKFNWSRVDDRSDGPHGWDLWGGLKMTIFGPFSSPSQWGVLRKALVWWGLPLTRL